MPDELLQSASYLQERVTGRDTWLRPPRGDEKTLQHYRDVYTAAALALRITRTPQLNAVLDDFTDPRRYQDAMPSQECLEAFEYGLLEAIYDAIVEHGQTQARRDLEEHFQMGPHEAQEMVSTARFAMTAAIELDQETERKIQSERLERLASKAARESDDRLVLATIKERSRLLGLTDRPPENSMQQIADVIAKVSADEDPFVPMLPDASDDF